jgi:DNA polymerase (family 10)
VAYTNQQVAEYLTNIATAYEIKHKNRFRIVAYENAADIALSYPEDIYQLWKKYPPSLDDIPNFGSAICQKVAYLFTYKKPHPTVVSAFKDIHPAVFIFTKINGIGPLIAHKLTQKLKFSSKSLVALEELIEHAQKHHVQELPTFGEKSELAILENTLAFMGRKNRMPLASAKNLADKVATYLHKKFPDIEFIPLGSLRRQSPTVGDIDIAAASTKPTEILDYLEKYPQSIETIARGSDKVSIRLFHDIRVDLMIKPPISFGALLQHFTGSRQHNILLRRHAITLGYSLSEYGIKNLKTKKINKFKSEEKFYNFLGFNYIPPKERVGQDELSRYTIKK